MIVALQQANDEQEADYDCGCIDGFVGHDLLL
jgi:hypothetical protein